MVEVPDGPPVPEPRRGLLALAAGAVFALCAYAGLMLQTRPPSPPALDLPTGVARSDGPVNVVLLVGCTLRADQVAGWGEHVDWTPFLARLGEKGARVRDPISTAPWTKPALISLLTGQHAVDLGMVEDSPRRNSLRLPETVELLAERFAAHGYATGGFVGNTNANRRFGLAQGFSHYHQPEGLWRDEVEKVEGWTLVDEALSWVGQQQLAHPEQPVYAQLVLVDGHLPDTTTDTERLAWVRPDLPGRVAGYRARLARFDANVQRLWEGLARMGLDERNTIFVVVGDHGEGLKYPEHHGKGHGNYLYESTVRVPLLVTGPGVPAGRWVEGLSSHLDVAPTLLALAGLPEDLGAGRSLAPALTGETDHTGRDEAWVQTWFGASQRAARYTDETVCLEDFDPEASADARRRNARREGIAPPAFPTGCYRRVDGDLGDPVEDDGLRAVREWHTAKLAHLAEMGIAPEADVDEATNAQLEALGYLEDGGGEGVPEQ